MVQPVAKAKSAEPVMTCSGAPAKTTKVRNSTPTSPVTTEPATTRAIGSRETVSPSGDAVRSAGWTGRARSCSLVLLLSGVVIGVRFQRRIGTRRP
jgi:hypothetical protein